MIQSITKFTRSKYMPLLSLLGFFSVWQILCMVNEKRQMFNPQFFPSPVDIITVIGKYLADGTLFKHIFISLGRVGMGFVIGTTVAVLLAIIITQSKVIDNMITPILNLIGPIPVYAFLPIFIIWFGIGESSKIGLIAFATFMPMMTYAIDGIRSVNPVFIRCAMSLGATRGQIFRKVIFKSALPNIFVGMKVSLALTFGALIVAEMMGADQGLGYIIINAKQWFKMSDMFMAIVLIGLLYTLFMFVIGKIEDILFKWRVNGIESAVEDKKTPSLGIRDNVIDTLHNVK